MGTASQKAEFYVRAERRIGWLTLGLGMGGALVIALVISRPAGVGVAVGAVLAWVNYRWLKQAAHAMSRVAAAQVDAKKSGVSMWVYVKFFARYALIALVLYVMVARFVVPIGSLLGGLLALGAAAMLESILELFGRFD